MTSIIRSAIGSVSALGFIKFLQENNFNVIGTDINPNCYCKDIVDKFHLVKKAPDEALANQYIEIIELYSVSSIISGPETEIIELAKKSDIFESLKVNLFHPNTKTLEVITNKIKLHEYLAPEFLVAETFKIDADENKYKSSHEKTIFKPSCGRGSSGLFFSTNKKEFQLLLQLLKNKEYIFQKYISGIEFSVDVLFNHNHEPINIIPRYRIQTDSGISIISRTVHNEQIIDIIEKLSKKIKFNGVACIQFIQDREKNLYLTDINPRFGGGSILSLQASQSFRNNLINILNGKEDKISVQKNDFNEVTMLRAYNEIYQY